VETPHPVVNRRIEVEPDQTPPCDANTHTLPGELERARDLLDALLVERAQEKVSER
jgi:hypothetical protein